MGRKAKTRRNAYGAWLHFLRREKNLTQAEAAKGSGIPRTTLMHWERTGNLTGRREILRLAKTYGVRVERLLRAEKFRSKSDH